MWEAIHWPDDPSLDLAIHLATAIPEAPLLVLALARPRLFERRPNWGQELAGHTRVTLTPLTTHLSRTLVDEILRLVNNVPDTLRDLIVNAAEGNPFYVCLLYTSDAADERSSVDLGGRRIIKKKKQYNTTTTDRLDSNK